MEIGGDYYLDDMRIVILSQGVVTTPLNSLEHQGPSLPDMLSQNNTGFLPAVDYSPGIQDINSHADIVTAGIALVDNALNDPRRVRMQQLRTDIPLETALSGVRTIDYSEGDLGKFFDELQSAGPGAIFLDLEGSKVRHWHFLSPLCRRRSEQRLQPARHRSTSNHAECKSRKPPI